MFSTPRRKIHAYSGKENQTPRQTLKPIGKEINPLTRIPCRTPLGVVNRKTDSCHHPTPVKDTTCEYVVHQPRASKKKRDQNDESENKAFAEETSCHEDTSILKSCMIPELAGSDLSERSLSFKESLALLSSTVSPVHEDASSVISLTSLDSQNPSPVPVDDTGFNLLVEKFVCEIIENAAVQLAEEKCHSGVKDHKTPTGEKKCTAPSQPALVIPALPSSASKVQSVATHICFDESLANEAEFSDIQFDADVVNPVVILDVEGRMSDTVLEDSAGCNNSCFIEVSGISSDLADSQCFSDSGLSVTCHQDNGAEEDVSLEEFLTFQAKFSHKGSDKVQSNVFLSVSPSKILNGAPRLLPAPDIDVPGPMSEYEIAKRARNLWWGDDNISRKERRTIVSKQVDSFPPLSPLIRSQAKLNGVNEKGEIMVSTAGVMVNREQSSPDVEMVNRSCGGSPALHRNQLVMTSPLQTVHQQTDMTPTIHSNQSCNTTPVQVANTSTVMTPHHLVSQSCSTSPVSMVSVETETLQPSKEDTGVGDSVATTCDSVCQRTPSQVHDKECSTSPIVTESVCQMTSPASTTDEGTSTTPISVSPIRLGNFSRKSENSVALMDQMKTSHICNKLLRREVSALRRNKTKWEEHLQNEQAEMKRKMSLIRQEKTAILETKQTAKMAAQAEIDDLLTQLGQQLGQIAELEGTVLEKDEDIKNLQRLNDERQKKYCEEIKELQDDLCLAYKQHEVQVKELEDKLEQQSCYERLYQKSVARTRALEEDLGAFTALEESLDRAAKLQEKMPVVEETFLMVKSLFEQTLKEKSVIVQKTRELQERTDRLEKDEERRCSERQCLFSDLQNITLQVEEEKKKTLLAETELQRVQEQFQELQETKDKLEMEMGNAVREIESFKLGKRTLEESMEALDNEKQSAEVDRQNTEDGLRRTIEELEGKNGDLSEVIKKLTDDNTRLINNEEPLKLKLEEATQSIETLKDQLKESQDSKEFLNQERETLEEYSKELEGKLKKTESELTSCKGVFQEGQMALHQRGMVLQNLQEQLQSSQSELEHTRQRAHHIIIQQGAQISSASTALADFVSRLDQYSSEVLIHKENNASVNEENQARQPSSFVFSILNSSPLRDQQEPSSVEANTSGKLEGSPAGLGDCSALGQSGCSAFSLVTPAKAAAVPPGQTEGDRSIAELVQQVNDQFNLLMERVLERLESAGQTIQEQEARSKQLLCDFQKVKKQHGRQLEEVSGSLRKSEEQVRNLKQELRSANSRTCDDKERLREALQRMQNGGGTVRTHHEIERMQKEMERLSVDLQRVERERALYQDQVTTLHGLMSSKSKSSSTMALIAKQSSENTQLKREMRILEENWQKAEAEVKSLDSLFDQCVKILGKVPQPVRDQDSNLKTLSRILLAP